MSTQTPTCNSCSTLTTFAGVTRKSETDESEYFVVWKCADCEAEVHDQCPTGPIIPGPDQCLSCGEDYPAPAGTVDRTCGCGLSATEAAAALGVATMPEDPIDAAHQAYTSGRFRAGLALLNKTVLADPSNEAAWLGKASFLDSMQFRAAHLQLLEHMISVGIGAAGAIYGMKLQEASRHQDAADAYRAFLLQLPEHQLAPQVTANLAVALTELGRPEEVDEFCAEAIHREPNRLCHYLNQATMLAHHQRFGDAIAVVDAGLVAVPGIPARIQLLETRSLILSDMQRGDDALLTIQQAIALGADSLRAHFCHGRALALVGELEHAREEIGLVLQHDPENIVAKQAMDALEAALESR